MEVEGVIWGHGVLSMSENGDQLIELCAEKRLDWEYLVLQKGHT